MIVGDSGWPSLLAAWLTTEAATFVTVAIGLVAAPLGVITFYMRSIREQQVAIRADHDRRFEHVESVVRGLQRRVSENERDFACKEDWLRESMLARRSIERLIDGMARVETVIERGTKRRGLRVEAVDESGVEAVREWPVMEQRETD